MIMDEQDELGTTMHSLRKRIMRGSLMQLPPLRQPSVTR